MLRNMNAALAMVVVAREPEAPWAASPFASHAPPDVELPPLTREELQERYEAGEVDADDCERVLVFASRMRAVIDVGIAPGLHALCQGDRLAQLGYWLDDYAARSSTSPRPPPATSSSSAPSCPAVRCSTRRAAIRAPPHPRGGDHPARRAGRRGAPVGPARGGGHRPATRAGGPSGAEGPPGAGQGLAAAPHAAAAGGPRGLRARPRGRGPRPAVRSRCSTARAGRPSRSST
jgi:hypothetical protein